MVFERIQALERKYPEKFNARPVGGVKPAKWFLALADRDHPNGGFPAFAEVNMKAGMELRMLCFARRMTEFTISAKDNMYGAGTSLFLRVPGSAHRSWQPLCKFANGNTVLFGKASHDLEPEIIGHQGDNYPILSHTISFDRTKVRIKSYLDNGIHVVLSDEQDAVKRGDIVRENAEVFEPLYSREAWSGSAIKHVMDHPVLKGVTTTTMWEKRYLLNMDGSVHASTETEESSENYWILSAYKYELSDKIRHNLDLRLNSFVPLSVRDIADRSFRKARQEAARKAIYSA